jgi:hypothetical protein
MNTDEDDGPLTKDEFRSQCQVRNPYYRTDLLALWQALPPVLREVPAASRTRTKAIFLDGEPLRNDRGKANLPPLWKPCGQAYRVARIKSQGELASAEMAIRFFLSMASPWWQLVDLFHNEAEYTECTGISPQRRDEILKSFRGKWPAWSVGRLRRPHVPLWWSSRPAVLVSLLSAQQGGFLDELPQGIEPAEPEEVFLTAPLMIPIYQDTRAEDLNWEEISKWQERVYGKKRRTRDVADLRELLDIWDRVNVNADRIPDIAHALRQPISTVRSKYSAVNKIIMQGLDTKKTESTLASIARTAGRIDHCRECMALINAGRMKLCAKHEMLVSEGTKSLRETTGDVERIQHGKEQARTGRKRKADGADRQAEKSRRPYPLKPMS